MHKLEIIKAWKDTEYRSQLSGEELALLPEHPAGSIELADEELDEVVGGNPTTPHLSAGCPCTGGWVCAVLEVELKIGLSMAGYMITCIAILI